ncbi:hypothetical protein [Cohnella nanjingensis]|uniref:Right-handed parallel beta-helix repeat-containing protein n=1 Tax=Cohnella nanjingensis TaxID=1387779 RepID=A0A7X0RQ63_9BACL|nr:hypothetical protein [Cohnella nanjingensis]MBB6671682.1 hypothetical protein [Cohnella nanjingensis]
MADGTVSINDGGITSAKIADGAIADAKIANGAVTNAKVADGAITNAKIADGAITNAKIVDGQITEGKLANASVTTAKIGDGHVTGAKLAKGTITQDKLAFAVPSGGASGNPDKTTIYLQTYLDAGQTVAQAFASANAAILAAIETTPSNDNRVGRVKLKLPGGRLIINDPNVFLQLPPTRTCGLLIEGAGDFATEIVFQPGAANQALITNTDNWLFLTFRDMNFVGDVSKAAGLTFMDSFSSGGAQNYLFERVNWTGTWRYGLHLTGSNVNSEMSFFHCGISGTWETFFWAETSDQFVNYNFYACQFEVSEGNFCRFTKGGNVNVWGGSLIHSGANGGTFFLMEGGAHAYSTCRFLCQGTRIEHRTDKSKMIDCAWPSGSVKFVSVDNTSTTGQRAANWTFARFAPGNDNMPVVSFDGCMLMGKAEFVFSTNTFDHMHNAEFANCEFSQYANATDMIVYTGTANPGGQPVVRFRNCRYQGTNAVTAIFDTNVGSSVGNRAAMETRSVSIKTASGQLPARGGYEDFNLPLNAIVTRVVLFSPAGAVTSGNAADFKVQTRETTPQVLASVQATPHSAGFKSDTTLFYVCSSDAKRQFRLLSGASVDQFNGKGYCIVYYMS